MATKQTKSNNYGDFLLGEGVAGDPQVVDGIYEYLPGSPDEIGTTALGLGAPVQRAALRPITFKQSRISAPDRGATGVSVGTVSGAFLGRLRTDARRTIVNKIDFTVDDKGCADFSITLNNMPPFPILDSAKVQITPFDDIEPWFSGKLTDIPEKGTGNQQGDDNEGSGYVFRGVGLRKTLENNREAATYAAVQDVGAIINDFVSTYVLARTGVRYDPSKIDSPTGVLIVNNVELSKHPFSKVFDTFAEMAQRQWGVDGTDSFYFTDLYADIKGTIFVGYNCHDVSIKTDPTTVKNSILIQRQTGLGSGSAGWLAAVIRKDDESIQKYEKRELVFQVPGAFGDDECTLLAENLLARYKDPSRSFEIKNYVLRSKADRFVVGRYKIVFPPGLYDDSVNDCEDASQWVAAGPGDLAVTNSSTKILSGAKSIRLQYTSAANDIAVLTLPAPFKGFIKKIRLWVYCSRAGQLFTLGIGRTLWNEHTNPVSISLASQFQLIEWDVSGLNLRQIGQIGFRIDDASGSPTSIYIDRIEATTSGHKTFIAKLKRAKYSFSPTEQKVDLEFGDLPAKLEQYIAGLAATASELRFTGEIR